MRWSWRSRAQPGVQAQCEDPFDNVLCAYTLTPAEEAQFSSTDNQVSAFWSNWGARDYFDLVAPDDCYPGRCNFSGASDAGLVGKAAGTQRGIYLYFEAMDNTWVDRSGQSDIGADATDMFLDIYDASYIFTCTDCLIGLYDSRLSYTTNQFQVWMGATSVPTELSYQYYDGGMWSWTQTFPSFANAKTVYGFEAEVVTVDATHKVQEWFFPWEKLGTQGLAIGTALGNKRIAFTGGYNDKDGDNPDNDCLRWTGKDPWVSDGNTVNYWGDLLLASDMGNVVAVLGTSTRRTSGAASPTGRVAGSEYYTLKGERVQAERVASLPTGSMVVRRTVGTSGAPSSELVRVGR